MLEMQLFGVSSVNRSTYCYLSFHCPGCHPHLWTETTSGASLVRWLLFVVIVVIATIFLFLFCRMRRGGCIYSGMYIFKEIKRPMPFWLVLQKSICLLPLFCFGWIRCPTDLHQVISRFNWSIERGSLDRDCVLGANVLIACANKSDDQISCIL